MDWDGIKPVHYHCGTSYTIGLIDFFFFFFLADDLQEQNIK